MRLIRITTNYPTYLDRFYQARPQLENESYSAQHRALMDDCFGWADFWTRAMTKLGYEVWEPVGNAAPQQKAWAREHGVSYGEDDWLRDIVTAQVKTFQPDVVFVNDYNTYTRDFLEDLRNAVPSIRLILGWCGAPYADAGVFHAYDVVLSNITSLVEHFVNSGHRSEEVRHAFHPSVLQRLQNQPGRKVPFSFAGSIVKNRAFHNEREELLKYLLRHSDLEIWSDIQAPPILDYRRLVDLKQNCAKLKRLRKLPGGGTIAGLFPRFRDLDPDDEPDLSKFVAIDIAEKAKSPVYGLAMYQLLHDSDVTLNNHIDISAGYANNLRLYEATGAGACLLTDWKPNLPDLFVPDYEVATYWSAEEALEKARYLIDHAEERRRIAEAGQKRTLRDHTFDVRAQQLDEIIRRMSATHSRLCRGSGSQAALANTEMPPGAPLVVIDDSLKGQVGIDPAVRFPDWGFERLSPSQSFVWLGHGRKDGLHLTLWAASARIVLVEAQVVAGPARPDIDRTLGFTCRNDSATREERHNFSGAATVKLLSGLTAGRNKLDIEVLDSPTVRIPNDSRPLLVRLTRVQVNAYDGSRFGPPDRPLVTLAPELRDKAVLGLEPRMPLWSLEGDAGHSWLWLGTGPEEGFGGTIHSNTECDLNFDFNVRPGPSRPDEHRTLIFRLEGPAGSGSRLQVIDGPGRVVFRDRVCRGVTSFLLEVLESATQTLPDDPRPLLVCISDVRISDRQEPTVSGISAEAAS